MDRAVAESGATDRARAALAGLTPREHEVVVGIARGETNAEIAARLFMSLATVKSHITRILMKLALTNRTQIALLAHDADLVDRRRRRLDNGRRDAGQAKRLQAGSSGHNEAVLLPADGEWLEALRSVPARRLSRRAPATSSGAATCLSY